MNNKEVGELVFLVGTAVILCWASFNIGSQVGSDRACQSVKMEWVKDKCMRVTREEVK
jgi:hypothetical protein